MKDRGRFRGNFSRNEVEMDVGKFIDILQENYALKEEIRELKYHDESNPWQKWVHFAYTMDAWRIFPRLFITVYMFLIVYSALWYMNLEAPTMEQSGLISVIIGAGAGWFGLYVTSRGDGPSSNKSRTSIDINTRAADKNKF
jgi:hypothetical protein